MYHLLLHRLSFTHVSHSPLSNALLILTSCQAALLHTAAVRPLRLPRPRTLVGLLPSARQLVS